MKPLTRGTFWPFEDSYLKEIAKYTHCGIPVDWVIYMKLELKIKNKVEAINQEYGIW